MMISESNILWNKCLEIFKDNLSNDEQFEVWFKPITAEYAGDKLTLSVPSAYFKEQFEVKFWSLLKSTFKHVYGSDVKVWFTYNVVQTEKDTNVVEKDAGNSNIVSKVNSLRNPFEKVEYEDIDPQLNLRYTFENYCGSMSNKLAVSIGMAIASNPQETTFNPMFLFGPTGVGKTHLIQAIGIRIKEQNPRARVLYVTARTFESQYTAAVHINNRVNDFISFYQSLDVLIIDDIQEFAGNKVATQNAFFHIFNYLHQSKKQLILSCDCRPSEMEGIMPRLISRFKWGITVELFKPDYELRRNVLSLKAAQDGLQIPIDVLDYIATSVTESVRELEGIVVSLLAYATMMNREISIDLAKSVISNAVRISKKQITFELIVEVVSSFYTMDSDLLYTKSRKREISDARQLVMYLAKKHTTLSLSNIGSRLLRNHATVLHSCKTITDRLSTDKKLGVDIASIEEELMK